MTSTSTIRTTESIQLDEDWSRRMHDKFKSLAVNVQQCLLDSERNKSTYLAETEIRHEKLRKLLAETRILQEKLRMLQHGIDPWVFLSQQETLPLHSGIQSTEEEITQAGRNLTLSPLSSTPSSHPSPKLRGETRRSERIAQRNVTRNFAGMQSPSSPSPSSRRRGCATRKGTAVTYRKRNNRSLRMSEPSKVNDFRIFDDIVSS